MMTGVTLLAEISLELEVDWSAGNVAPASFCSGCTSSRMKKKQSVSLSVVRLCVFLSNKTFTRSPVNNADIGSIDVW